MSGWLLDTNVLSEFARREPSPRVTAFLARSRPAFVSVVSIHELRFGIERLPEGRRKEEFWRWLALTEGSYAASILAVGAAEAAAAARLRGGTAKRGRTIHLGDSLIAGTALCHDLIVATRNMSDFADLGLPVVDPWLG